MEEREIQIKIHEVDVPAIDVRDVVKVYKLYDKPRDRIKEAFGLGKKQTHKPHYALNGVSMNIYKGETVGIIGTNGSGKSTILKIITGVLTPTSGEVKVDGRISALLELGAGFNMEYSGIENVYLNGTMMGFSEKEIDAKLPEILEFADIGDYVHQPVKTYSSGMFVRLAFAVAINIEPEILIVDEALSVGDVFFQAKCYHKFEEFKKLGKTIVFVSHDLSSISKYCDRVFLLNKGKLLGEGSPKQMIDAYKRVLVGQYEVQEDAEENLLKDPELQTAVRQAMQGGRGFDAADGAGSGAGGGNGTGSTNGAGSRSGMGSTGSGSDTSVMNRTGSGNGTGGAESGSGAGYGRGNGDVGNGAEGGNVDPGRGTSAPDTDRGRNPNALEYGNKRAQILMFYVTDRRGTKTTAIIKGEEFTIHVRVAFREHVPAPIFAFSFKDVKGTEITGTNSMVEKAFLESVEQGQVKDVTFTQKMSLQGGEYLLSLGVTGYDGDRFDVYHRLYDAMNVTVISDKDTVGFYDMDSTVNVTDVR